MGIFKKLFENGVSMRVERVKGCPDLHVAGFKKGDRRVTAVLHQDGTINLQNERHEEIYDGDDGRNAAQIIFGWLAK